MAVDNESNVEENVRKSFLKVKNDMDSLKNELSRKNEAIERLERKLDVFLRKSQEIRGNSPFFDVSIGNKGVDNRQQQTTTDNSRQHWTEDQPEELPEENTDFDQKIAFRFKSLTERGFSMFLAIYELGREIGEVTYTDLANKLNLTESTIRTHIHSLVNKKLPILKRKFVDRKAYLSIDGKFNSAEIIAKIIKLRQDPSTQTKLSDI